MNIKYATYVDHQAEIQFPVEFLSKGIPGLLVYCSDAENQKVLLSSGVSAEVVGFKISSPSDVGDAQNLCVDRVFRDHNPDFVVWVQADMCVTSVGHEKIREYCEGNLGCDGAACLRIHHLRLFIPTIGTVFGVTVIGRNSRERFLGDGAYVGVFDVIEPPGDVPLVVDIGYLTIEQYKRHRRRHIITWADDRNERAKRADGFGDLEYLEFVLDRDKDILVDNKVVPRGSYLHDFIVNMGLGSEYDRVERLFCFRS